MLTLLMKNNMLKVVEMFKGLQGEAEYAGNIMLFIRLSGCTRQCAWCDTKFHKNVKEVLTPKQVAAAILKSKVDTVCFTGGEPLMHWEEIKEVIEIVREDRLLKEKQDIAFHIETNGDLIKTEEFFNEIWETFSYIAISPKELSVAKKVYKFANNATGVDIKIVTDLDTVGLDMLKYATILMPFTSYNKTKDAETNQKVWEYCVRNNKRISIRLHYMVWGKKQGV